MKHNLHAQYSKYTTVQGYSTKAAISNIKIRKFKDWEPKIMSYIDLKSLFLTKSCRSDMFSPLQLLVNDLR